MYFGSVRFFKHLIVFLDLLLIFVLAVYAGRLSIINRNYKTQISDSLAAVSTDTTCNE